MEDRMSTGEGISRLLEASEPKNQRLNSFFQDESSGAVDVPPLQDRRCALCHLTEFPYSIGENVMYETDEYAVVEAADDRSFRSRNMIVLKDHSYYPSRKELEDYAGEALQKLVDYTVPENEPVAVYADMNTFDHPHIMASDLTPADPEEAALETINNYLVFEDRQSMGNSVEEEYGDNVGLALLERFYSAANP